MPLLGWIGIAVALIVAALVIALPWFIAAGRDDERMGLK